MFLFLVVSPWGGVEGGGGLSFFLWRDIGVSVFLVLVLLLGYLLSEIGRRDVLEVCERQRESQGYGFLCRRDGRGEQVGSRFAENR